jgi:hypothetical protein
MSLIVKQFVLNRVFIGKGVGMSGALKEEGGGLKGLYWERGGNVRGPQGGTGED